MTDTAPKIDNGPRWYAHDWQALSDALGPPDGGFTVDYATCEHAVTGYAVSTHPECERVFGGVVRPDDLVRYVLDHAHALAQPGASLVGWRDPETGLAYLDVSAVVQTLPDALTLGEQHSQLAVFDLETFESVPVPAEDVA